MESEALWPVVVQAAEDKKGQNIVVFAIEGLSIMADYVVLVSGTSTTQVGAIAQGILDAVKPFEDIPSRVEGLNEAKWVLVDLGGVIVHVMTNEIRTFYALEQLWARAHVVYPQGEAVPAEG